MARAQPSTSGDWQAQGLARSRSLRGNMALGERGDRGHCCGASAWLLRPPRPPTICVEQYAAARPAAPPAGTLAPAKDDRDNPGFGRGDFAGGGEAPRSEDAVSHFSKARKI